MIAQYNNKFKAEQQEQQPHLHFVDGSLLEASHNDQSQRNNIAKSNSNSELNPPYINHSHNAIKDQSLQCLRNSNSATKLPSIKAFVPKINEVQTKTRSLFKQFKTDLLQKKIPFLDNQLGCRLDDDYSRKPKNSLVNSREINKRTESKNSILKLTFRTPSKDNADTFSIEGHFKRLAEFHADTDERQHLESHDFSFNCDIAGACTNSPQF